MRKLPVECRSLDHESAELLSKPCAQSNDKLFAHLNLGPSNSSSFLRFRDSSNGIAFFTSLTDETVATSSFVFEVENNALFILCCGFEFIRDATLLLGPARSFGGLWKRARFDVSSLLFRGLGDGLRLALFFAEPRGLLPRGLLPFLIVGFLLKKKINLSNYLAYH